MEWLGILIFFLMMYLCNIALKVKKTLERIDDKSVQAELDRLEDSQLLKAILHDVVKLKKKLEN